MLPFRESIEPESQNPHPTARGSTRSWPPRCGPVSRPSPSRCASSHEGSAPRSRSRPFLARARNASLCARRAACFPRVPSPAPAAAPRRSASDRRRLMHRLRSSLFVSCFQSRCSRAVICARRSCGQPLPMSFAFARRRENVHAAVHARHVPVSGIGSGSRRHSKTAYQRPFFSTMNARPNSGTEPSLAHAASSPRPGSVCDPAARPRTSGPGSRAGTRTDASGSAAGIADSPASRLAYSGGRMRRRPDRGGAAPRRCTRDRPPRIDRPRRAAL